MDLTALVIIGDGDGAGRPLKIFQRSTAPVAGSVANISMIGSNVDGHRRRGNQDALDEAAVVVVAGGLGVLGLGVTTKVDLALERPGADAAGERLEAGVLATVGDKVR